MYKFRAWDKDRKMMLDSDNDEYVILLSGEVGYFRRGCTDWWEKVDSLILMQSTNLFDKNKKEIYEGDIVKSDFQNELFVVKWEELSAGFYLDCKENELYCFDFDEETNKTLIVLGNIYENPDLIERQ